MTYNPSANTPLPWGNGPYSIKRHGATLTNCESEPVQTPGCIQAHGAMLAVRLSDLSILQASENTTDHLGTPPSCLLGRTVAQVVGEANATTCTRGWGCIIRKATSLNRHAAPISSENNIVADLKVLLFVRYRTVVAPVVK